MLLDESCNLVPADDISNGLLLIARFIRVSSFHGAGLHRQHILPVLQLIVTIYIVMVATSHEPPSHL